MMQVAQGVVQRCPEGCRHMHMRMCERRPQPGYMRRKVCAGMVREWDGVPPCPGELRDGHQDMGWGAAMPGAS